MRRRLSARRSARRGPRLAFSRRRLSSSETEPSRHAASETHLAAARYARNSAYMRAGAASKRHLLLAHLSARNKARAVASADRLVVCSRAARLCLCLVRRSRALAQPLDGKHSGRVIEAPAPQVSRRACAGARLGNKASRFAQTDVRERRRQVRA